MWFAMLLPLLQWQRDALSPTDGFSQFTDP
jgi:hypothetical protein